MHIEKKWNYNQYVISTNTLFSADLRAARHNSALKIPSESGECDFPSPFITEIKSLHSSTSPPPCPFVLSRTFIPPGFLILYVEY